MLLGMYLMIPPRTPVMESTMKMNPSTNTAVMACSYVICPVPYCPTTWYDTYAVMPAQQARHTSPSCCAIHRDPEQARRKPLHRCCDKQNATHGTAQQQ